MLAILPEVATLMDRDSNLVVMRSWSSILRVTHFGLAPSYKYSKPQGPPVSNSFPCSLLPFYSRLLT